MSDKVLEIGMNALKAQGKLPLSVIGTDYAQISIAISLQRIADALERIPGAPEFSAHQFSASSEAHLCRACGHPRDYPMHNV